MKLRNLRHHTRIPVRRQQLATVICLALFTLLCSDQGRAQGNFRRGDANGDGNFEIADGVRILGWLFLGGAEPSCLDSADVNDDGAVDVSDALRILGYLFLGGRSLDGIASDALLLLFPVTAAIAAADTLSPDEALNVAVLASAFRLLRRESTGRREIELRLMGDPYRGTVVEGWVGSQEVRLEVDSGSVAGEAARRPAPGPSRRRRRTSLHRSCCGPATGFMCRMAPRSPARICASTGSDGGHRYSRPSISRSPPDGATA